MSNHIFSIEQVLIKGRVVKVNNFHQPTYRVVFENGYQNIFFKDVESGNWMEEDLGFTDLAKQLGNKVMPFEVEPVHVPRKLYWHGSPKNPSSRFGFYPYRDGEKKLFEVYHFNKKYLYSLEWMDDSWSIFKVNQKLLDGDLVNLFDHVMKTLPLYTYDIQ